MPELDGKKYEYTEEGKAQYEKDKERLNMATGGGTSIKSIISNLLPSLYGKNTKVEKKGSLDFGYQPSFLYQPRVQKLTGGVQKQEGGELTHKEAMQILQDIKDGKRDDIPTITVYGKRIEKSELEKFKDAQPEGLLKGTIFDYVPDPVQTVIYLKRRQAEKAAKRNKKQEGGGIEAEMGELMPEEAPMPLEMAEEPTETMLPDEQMEEDYTDFIIGESLTPEDEEYLLNALEQDDRLSMIFDQVVDTASEFSGSGSVTGPGTEMSDSIPARLSDGEFVMTSKAANQIGPDNLQGLMEVAEMEADNEGRQIKQAGGYVEEEENEEQEIVRAIQSKEAAGRVMPTSLADKKVNESMIALNPRNSLFAT